MEQFNINKGVTIKPGLDVLPPPVTDDEYRALMAGEDRYLMTESNTLEEIELRSSMTRRSTGVLRIYWRRLALLVCSYTGLCRHLSGH